MRIGKAILCVLCCCFADSNAVASEAVTKMEWHLVSHVSATSASKTPLNTLEAKYRIAITPPNFKHDEVFTAVDSQEANCDSSKKTPSTPVRPKIFSPDVAPSPPAPVESTGTLPLVYSSLPSLPPKKGKSTLVSVLKLVPQTRK